MYQIDIVPWDENFNTGLELIDRQHQKLVKIINELAEKLAFSSQKIDLDTIFNDLIEYTNYHFDSEEAIWHKYLKGHETEERHKKNHTEFMEKVKTLIDQQHEKSVQEITEHTLGFLVEWLVSHILESDRYLANVVIALQAGETFDTAVKSAEVSMRGYTSQMIEMIKNTYKSLVNNTLKFMHEIEEQRSTEKKLKLSEERLSYALSGTSDGLWDWNLESGSMYYSARWFGMLGYEENELDSTLDTWVALVHPDDKDRSLQTIEDHVNSNSSNFEMEFRMEHKDGHWVFILSRGSLARDSDGAIVEPRRVIGTHVDISKQKEAEYLLLDKKEELNNYKNKLEHIVEERTKELLLSKEETDEAMERFNEAMLAIEDGIWDWNIVTNEVYYSPAWQTMLGYDVGEIAQVIDSWRELLHPDDLEMAFNHAQRFINNESKEYRMEFRMICKDGSSKWVLARAKDAERDEDGKVTRIIGTHVDI